MAWELFKRDTVGYEVVGVDGDLLDAAPISHLPVACEITIDAPSALPDALAETEMALEQVVAATRGRLAGTIRSESRLWNLVALPNDDQVDEFAGLPLPERARITVTPTNDPEWTIFDRVRPIGMERQSMDDLRVVRNLHDHGDIGGPRQILHVVQGVSGDHLQGFVASMRSLGYVTEVDAPELGVLVIHEAVPSEVTSDSWTIRQVAERIGARYDGWRCEVRRGRPKRRRGWLSRRR
ncbi:MAG: ribonuclease E inhibitor RraB [Actinomycetota bacterium]